MASSALQVVGFVLGVLSWAGMIGTCASPEWRKNRDGQTFIDNTLRYDGLWVRCKAFSTGQTNCEDYNVFFIGLPEVLQVCRALMIAAIVLGFIAILITILGMKCTNIAAGNQKAKAIVSMIGGLLFGIAGDLLAVCIYFAYQWMTSENFSPMTAYYIAIATALLSNIACVFVMIGTMLFREDYGSHNMLENSTTAAMGIFVGAAVSYYAHGVVQEYYNPVLDEDTPMHLRFEYGAALFVGWASLVLGLLGGIILCFTSVFIILRLNVGARRTPYRAKHPDSAPKVAIPYSQPSMTSHSKHHQKQNSIPLVIQHNPHNKQAKGHGQDAKKINGQNSSVGKNGSVNSDHKHKRQSRTHSHNSKDGSKSLRRREEQRDKERRYSNRSSSFDKKHRTGEKRRDDYPKQEKQHSFKEYV